MTGPAPWHVASRVGRFLSVCAILAVWASVCLGASSGQASPDLALASIREDEARAKLLELVSEKTAGRRAGTEGARVATAFIASVFEKAGLAPGGDDGTYFQSVPIHRACLPGDGNGLSLQCIGWRHHAAYLTDVVPLGISASARARGDVVFAGYGLVTKGWHDYEGLDVRGKIVLAMRSGPRSTLAEASASEYAGATGPAYTFHGKALAAQEHGAAGLILVTDPVHQEEDGRLACMAGRGPGIGIPCVHVSPRIANLLLAFAGTSLSDRQAQMDRTARPAPVSIPMVEVSLCTSIEWGAPACRNVMGILPGSDPELKDEVVIVGGHHDHLGYGDIGVRAGSPGEVFPGADDNASGTVGVMEIAEAFCSLPKPPRRTLVFACFAAEEAGLVGSRHFTAHPPIALDRVVAMINLDMIGRGKGKGLSVAAVGTAEPWEGILREQNKAFGFDLKLSKDAYPGSDHRPFQERKIPVLYFCTGGNPDYHSPRDTADKVRFANLANVAGLAYRVALAVANAPRRPMFEEPVSEEGEKPEVGVKLGVYPDDWYDGFGAKLDGISSNTPADRAGLKPGDIIVEYGGKPVVSIRALRPMLAETPRGATVKVKVVSGGKVKDLRVTFD